MIDIVLDIYIGLIGIIRQKYHLPHNFQYCTCHSCVIMTHISHDLLGLFDNTMMIIHSCSRHSTPVFKFKTTTRDSILLPYNITVFAFDFTGSGLSEGDYVSLGNYEKQDVGTIVEYLWSTKRVSRIGLWGRSMGAATSIMYASIDQSIAGIVVDSPFTSLEDLAMELVHSYQSWIPKKMIKMGINLIRKSIIGKAGFDIRSCAPIECAGSCFVPALFAHAENDDFIKIHHSEKLYETYAGDKNMIRFEGDHNSARPDFMYDSVCIFFYNVLVSNDKELENKDIPKGSMAHKNDVGVVTEKGRQSKYHD